jgi:hypothetical protein
VQTGISASGLSPIGETDTTLTHESPKSYLYAYKACMLVALLAVLAAVAVPR